MALGISFKNQSKIISTPKVLTPAYLSIQIANGCTLYTIHKVQELPMGPFQVATDSKQLYQQM